MREFELFDAARRLDADKRVAFLDEACAGDRGMRLRIEALMQAHEMPGGILDQPEGGDASVETIEPGDHARIPASLIDSAANSTAIPSTASFPNGVTGSAPAPRR